MCDSSSSSLHHSQMVEEQKALVLQKYARAWLVRRRFQTMRRLVINVQLSYRVQQLGKKIEEKVDTGWVHSSGLCVEDVTEAESSQNKDNLGLMERLTSEANARSQAVERLQALEAKLVKLTTEKASWEARETKAKEEASLVSAKSGSCWR